jgi:hypothetical protein
LYVVTVQLSGFVDFEWSHGLTVVLYFWPVLFSRFKYVIEKNIFNFCFKAADILAVRQKRRIYDITNVLEGIGLIEKKSKNSIQWKYVHIISGKPWRSPFLGSWQSGLDIPCLWYNMKAYKSLLVNEVNCHLETRLFKIYLIPCHLCDGVQNSLLPLGFLSHFVCVCHFSCMFNMCCPSYHPWFDYPNVWRGVQIWSSLFHFFTFLLLLSWVQFYFSDFYSQVPSICVTSVGLF